MCKKIIKVHLIYELNKLSINTFKLCKKDNY